MIFYKKHANIECIKYNEALEEALCFGWIDSIIEKIDNDQYVRKFTPRTNTTKWSELNKKIVICTGLYKYWHQSWHWNIIVNRFIILFRKYLDKVQR